MEWGGGGGGDRGAGWRVCVAVKGQDKNSDIIFVLINVSYANHMCVILCILQHISKSYMYTDIYLFE